MITKNNDKAGVGNHIVTHCGRCDHDMNHTVVAHGADGIVARVKCMVCGSEHNYKRTTPARTKISGAANTIKKVNIPMGPKHWEEAKASASNKVPLTYKMTDWFNKNSLIQHPTLGEGVVIQSYDNKIDVIFRDGIKPLVHNRK
ncbi:MAG: hypothetical protein V1647_03340 [Pseudomonadota bacterium]